MLLSLPEDCLRLIIEFLKFDDKIQLLKVCSHLNNAVTEIWQRDCSLGKTIKFTGSTSKKYKKEKYYEYLKCVSGHIEILKLDRTTSSGIFNLRNIQFPKVHKLTYRSSSYCNNYRASKIIHQMFPNLKALIIRRYSKNLNLNLFKNLQELHLSSFSSQSKVLFSSLALKKLSLSFPAFKQFRDSNFKFIADCETLEEIRIDRYYPETILECVTKLKNLRKISFCIWDNRNRKVRNSMSKNETLSNLNLILKQAVLHYGNVMETLIYNYDYEYSERFFDSLNRIVPLRRLVFINGFTVNKWDLKNISPWLIKTLKEFYFVNDQFLPYKEEGMLKVVRQCINLELLDLSNTNINKGFIQKVANIVCDQGKKRTKTLTLRCYTPDTRIKSADLKELDLPNNLKICLKEKEIKMFSLRECIICELEMGENGALATN